MTRNCAGANAGAPFSENVMIIWDEDDVWGPNKNTRCAICHDRLRLPVVMWDAGYIDDEGYVVPHTAYVCNECCIRMCHGPPGTADDPLRHGHWRANRPAGNWVHAGCIHPYQAAGRWK
jgi:hypothetical protein